MPYFASRLEAATGDDLKRIFGGRPAQSLIEYEDVDPQRCVDIRASWAAQGVIAYADYLSGEMGCEVSTVISDFLSDLHHLCDALDVDYAQAVDTAFRRHHEEVKGL